MTHRAAPEDWRLKQATVSKESDGSYYVSVLYECEAVIMPQEVHPEQLAKTQRKLKAKQPHSANYRKQQKKVARAAKKAANQYHLVCVEDLSLRALANRKFRNGKATMDNGALKQEARVKIYSIVVPEFKGLDKLPTDLGQLQRI